MESPYYAGQGSVFGGKGPSCKNCSESKPVNIRVDVTAALNSLRKTRDEVRVEVVCLDEHDVVCHLSELATVHGGTVAIPAPIMVELASTNLTAPPHIPYTPAAQ